VLAVGYSFFFLYVFALVWVEACCRCVVLFFLCMLCFFWYLIFGKSNKKKANKKSNKEKGKQENLKKKKANKESNKKKGKQVSLTDKKKR
jgi:Ca2+/Na+ antiporter